MKYKLLLREELTLCVLPIVIWWARQETVPFPRATVGILIHVSAVMLSYYGCYWRLRKGEPRFAGWVTDGILFTGMVAVFSLSIWGSLSMISVPIVPSELLRLSSSYSLAFLMVNLIFMMGQTFLSGTQV